MQLTVMEVYVTNSISITVNALDDRSTEMLIVTYSITENITLNLFNFQRCDGYSTLTVDSNSELDGFYIGIDENLYFQSTTLNYEQTPTFDVDVVINDGLDTEYSTSIEVAVDDEYEGRMFTLDIIETDESLFQDLNEYVVYELGDVYDLEIGYYNSNLDLEIDTSTIYIDVDDSIVGKYDVSVMVNYNNGDQYLLIILLFQFLLDLLSVKT